MKGFAQYLLPLLSVSTVWAYQDNTQIVLEAPHAKAELPNAFNIAHGFLDDAKQAILKGKKNLEKWIHDGREFIKQDGLMCESILVPSFGHPRVMYARPRR